MADKFFAKILQYSVLINFHATTIQLTKCPLSTDTKIQTYITNRHK